MSNIKLRDYRKNPKEYQELKNVCKNIGMVATDETLIIDILREQDRQNAILSICNTMEKEKAGKIKIDSAAADGTQNYGNRQGTINAIADAMEKSGLEKAQLKL